MTVGDYRLKAQVAMLREIAMDYPGKTIDNIIVQLESRIKEAEQCR